MRVPRLLLPGQELQAGTLTLDTEASHYLTRVLRRRPGDPILLGDGAGALWQGRVDSSEGRRTCVVLEASVAGQSESPLHTHLGIALLRGDRMDYALQKACEMGVHGISLLLTERVEVKLEAKRLSNRMAHFRGVLQHAAQQSGRSMIPTLEPPLPLARWCSQLPEPAGGLRLVMDPEAEPATLGETAPASVTLVSGPEGGLTRAEVTALMQVGFHACLLGPRVLRAETAPIAGLSVLQWQYGDFTPAHKTRPAG